MRPRAASKALLDTEPPAASDKMQSQLIRLQTKLSERELISQRAKKNRAQQQKKYDEQTVVTQNEIKELESRYDTVCNLLISFDSFATKMRQRIPAQAQSSPGA